MMTMLERAQATLGADLPPVMNTIGGFRMIFFEPGRAAFELEASDRHHNPMGTLHGGILCDLADAAMGVAYGAALGEGESFTTLELKINFLKPVRTGRLRADARVLKAGRNVGLVECDVVDESGSLVARASSTCMTVRGQAARAR